MPKLDYLIHTTRTNYGFSYLFVPLSITYHKFQIEQYRMYQLEIIYFIKIFWSISYSTTDTRCHIQFVIDRLVLHLPMSIDFLEKTSHQNKYTFISDNRLRSPYSRVTPRAYRKYHTYLMTFASELYDHYRLISRSAINSLDGLLQWLSSNSITVIEFNSKIKILVSNIW